MEQALYTVYATTSTLNVAVQLCALTDNSACFLAFSELQVLGYKQIAIVKVIKHGNK
jgi:hypothetical protein